MAKRMHSNPNKSEHIVYERCYPPRLEVHELILNNVDWSDVRNVLDGGCGFGEFLELVNSKKPGINLVGLDIDRKLITEAINKVEADFIYIM